MHTSPLAKRKPWYRVLYIQVLIAVLLGVAVGYFFPGFGVSLKPLGDGDAPHGEAAKAIHALLPGSIMTIEMVRAEGESALAAVDRAIGFARRTYDAEPGAC